MYGVLSRGLVDGIAWIATGCMQYTVKLVVGGFRAPELLDVCLLASACLAAPCRRLLAAPFLPHLAPVTGWHPTSSRVMMCGCHSVLLVTT